METLIKPKRSVIQKTELALHEFYCHSIYKKMVDDFTGATYNRSEQQNNVVASKKSESPKGDMNDDLPGMLFI